MFISFPDTIFFKAESLFRSFFTSGANCVIQSCEIYSKSDATCIWEYVSIKDPYAISMKCDLSFNENLEVPSAKFDVMDTAALRICEVNAKSSFAGNASDNRYIFLTYCLAI